MGKVVLFDLDGTLIPANTEEFIKDYMVSLADYVADYFPKELFMKSLLASTEAVVRSVDGRFTNQEVFMENFLEQTQLELTDIMTVLEEFYLTQFPLLQKHVQSSDLTRDIVETVINQGRKVVIATNPLFPMLAVVERLRWVNIDDIEFALITSYENSHYSKPHVQYYREILGKLELEPEETIMIGNDMQEDMVASELGIRTYLVEDYLLDRNGQKQYHIDQQGSIEDLKKDIKSKSGIFA